MEYMNTFIFSMVRYSALIKNLDPSNVLFHVAFFIYYIKSEIYCNTKSKEYIKTKK